MGAERTVNDMPPERVGVNVPAVWKKVGSKRALWDNLRSHFRHFTFQSMKHLYEVILYSLAKNLPAPSLDSS